MNGGAIRFPENTTPWFWKTAGRLSSFGTSWPEGGTGSEEWSALKSHFVTSKTGRGGRRKLSRPPEPTKPPIGFIHTKDERYGQ